MKATRTIIEPQRGLSLRLNELWEYRELFYFFTWRDIKVKYKQTALGVIWALLQPLGIMLLFTFIFSRTLHFDSSIAIPYPVFVLSGLIIWNLFYSSVSQASESMVQNSNIIKKIYFPRLIIPCSAILVSLFDFSIAFLIFIGVSLYYHEIHWSAFIYFPAGILLTLFSAFGIGSFLAALNVKFRDFRYAIPFVLQVLFFASQVIYPLDLIKDKQIKYLLGLNPVNGAIELFRSPITSTTPDMVIVTISFATALLVTFTGLLYFRKTEAYFADIV